MGHESPQINECIPRLRISENLLFVHHFHGTWSPRLFMNRESDYRCENIKLKYPIFDKAMWSCRR